MTKLKRKMGYLLCICFILGSVTNVYAADEMVTKSVDEDMVYGTITIGTINIPDTNILALGDANADIEGNGVRLRTGPGTSHTILELMYNGETVGIDFHTSYTQSNGTWLYVKRTLTGTWGWVKREYVWPWD